MAKLKLDNGALADARSLFVQFLEKWPSDAMASSAQYWIAKSYFQEKNYKQAGLEFQKVHKDYPKSDKAPDALLKVAYSFVELNMKDEAKLFLEAVGQEYPKSTAAKSAEKKLAEIKHQK